MVALLVAAVVLAAGVVAGRMTAIAPQAVAGYWRAVDQRGIVGSSIGPYSYSWYAIDPADRWLGGLTTMWDNGMNCSTSRSHLFGPALWFIDHGRVNGIWFLDGSHAVAAFQDGLRFHVKRLTKIRDDPEVVCD